MPADNVTTKEHNACFEEWFSAHGAKLSTFIFRVAHNAALTWKRTQKNYRKRVDAFESSTLLPRKRELEALRAAYGEDESGEGSRPRRWVTAIGSPFGISYR